MLHQFDLASLDQLIALYSDYLGSVNESRTHSQGLLILPVIANNLCERGGLIIEPPELVKHNGVIVGIL